MNKRLPHISIEKYAAYLDGNLPEEEMQQMERFIENDEDMQAFLEADEIVDSNCDLPEQDPIPFDIELVPIDIPSIDMDLTLEHNSFLDNIFPYEGDSYGEEVGSIIDEIHKTNNNMTNRINYNFSLFGKKDAATEVFGEPGNGSNADPRPEIYQGYKTTCAIRSQQIILRDYGIDMSQEQLIAMAEQNGWYSEKDGTPMGYVGFLLQSSGVGVHQQIDSTIYDLINELAQGHRIIVGVDSGELWAIRDGKISEQLKEFWEDLWHGQNGADHALIVAGVEVNPKYPSDVTVVLTDPGTGDLRIEYSLDDFMDAWEDSKCFMVATDAPAPYQYDETRGMMVPSNFYCEEFINQNSYPLSPNALYIPEGYSSVYSIPEDYEAYYSEGYLNSIGHDDNGNEISFKQFRDVYNKAHSKYRQVSGSSAAVFGQDHFDKQGFVDAIKGLFGVKPSIDSHDGLSKNHGNDDDKDGFSENHDDHDDDHDDDHEDDHDNGHDDNFDEGFEVLDFDL